MRTNLFSSAATAAFLGATLASPALAADDQSSGADAGDIIVTARRTEERLQDVPISISVFTQEQVSSRNIVNSTDLAAYTPSLSTNTRYGPEKAAFSIRGFAQENQTSPSVGVYFADVIAPRSQGNTTSGNGAGVGSLFDLQNIQVLKGPQGTLFGRNTTGGSILLVPNKPTDTLEGYVEGTLGGRDQRRVQAVLNLPLADTFKVRLGVDRNKRDGWLHNRSAFGAKDYNDVNYLALRLSIVADLTPDLENYTVVSYGKSDTNGALGKIGACDRTAVRNYQVASCAEFNREVAAGFGPYDVYTNVNDPVQKIVQWQIINTTTWHASDTLTVKNIASYSEFREANNFDHSGNSFSLNNVPYSFVRFKWGPQAKGYGVSQSTATEELQLQGRSSDGRLNWQAGGYVEVSDPIAKQELYSSIFANCTDLYSLQCQPALLQTGPASFAALGSISISRNTYKFRNYGTYAQATYNITDQLAATGGIRYTWDRTTGRGDNVFVALANAGGPARFACNTNRLKILPNANPGQCVGAFTAKSNKPTWMFDLEYKPIDDMLLYAKYSRGYRQGSVNPSVAGFESWQPEKVDSYEVGAKTSWNGAVGGNLNITGFYNNFSDMQLQYNLTAQPGQAAGGNAIVNVGKARIWGIEVDSTLRLFEGFKVDLGYAYLNTKLKEAPNVTLTPDQLTVYSAIIPTALVGDSLALAPKHKLSVTGTYTLPLDESLGEVSVAATFTHTDKQFYSHNDDRFVAGLGVGPQALLNFNPGQLPATNLLNLNANWKNVFGAPVDLSFFMTNVTKKKYWTAVSNSLPTTGVETFYLGEPRMWGFRLRYKFGN